MHVMTQATDRQNGRVVVMFTLMPRPESPPDSDDGIEVAFRHGLTDGSGNSPDFVVPLEAIADMVTLASFEVADEPLGMALRVVALEQHLDEAVMQVAAFVAARAALAYNEPVTCGPPRIVS